jgi:hypothetical protein
MILEITNYYPRPGMEAAVLAHRHRGCDVREALGLPRGEVFVLIDGTGSPVRWMCRYATEAEFRADLLKRTESPDFAVQRQEMGKLTERFERAIYRLDP